jgi:hypothetical protein
VRVSDVIILDTPHGDLIAISSSSYKLSPFSSKAGFGHIVGVGAAPEKSSSVSIDDLWPGINSARGTNAERSERRVEAERLRGMCGSGILGQASMRLSTIGRGYGMKGGRRGGFVRDKAARILADSVIPHSEKEGMKPLYVCPGCSNHTYRNNMITRIHVQ